MRYGKKPLAVVFLSAFFLVFMAQGLFVRPGSANTGTRDFWLEAWSSQQYALDCNAHDVLSGTLQVKQDGDLFPGDQTKYDLWLIQGVSIIICNQENYNLWVNGKQATTILTKDHVSSCSWRSEVPESGRWYVVYYSDSVFRKHIEVSISQLAAWTPAGVLIIASVAALSAVTFTLVLRFIGLRSIHSSIQAAQK
jgi:hypothetical protein